MSDRLGAAAVANRLDELRAQAQYARERFDLYKAKTYGPRLTSPGRLRELERQSSRAEANFRFAKAEAARDAEPAGQVRTEPADEAGPTRPAVSSG